MKEKIIEKIEQYVEELLQKPTLTPEESRLLIYWIGKLKRDEWRREMEEKTPWLLGGNCCEL